MGPLTDLLLQLNTSFNSLDVDAITGNQLICKNATYVTCTQDNIVLYAYILLYTVDAVRTPP